jgi:pyruvate dehydrogenase E1 component
LWRPGRRPAQADHPPAGHVRRRRLAGADSEIGQLLEEIFHRPGGESLRLRIDQMTNPEYQRLLRHTASELRVRLPGDGPGRSDILAVIDGLDDDVLVAAISNLGGHDIPALRAAFTAIDDTRPTVIFAYTVKGHGLPIAGHPQNHSSQLTATQMTALATALGVDFDNPWQAFTPDSPAGRLCAATAALLKRDPVPAPSPLEIPVDLGHTPSGIATTQAALGRTLVDLTRIAPTAAARIVTVSPDVASSTNLGGWVNKVGVWANTEHPDWFADDVETILHWREKPSGQHIELGIAETDLVGVLGELGATWSRWGEPLLPIGVMYDPFVERALEPRSFGIYAGGQSILVGTPSGVTLAPAGGAHQSIKTPSIGLEQPGCTTYEPAFAIDTEWTLLESLRQLGRPEGSSAYLRLSTRPVDQTLAQVPTDPAARERRRRNVVAGGYLIRRAETAAVTICTMGAMITEALAAADRCRHSGLAPTSSV